MAVPRKLKEFDMLLSVFDYTLHDTVKMLPNSYRHRVALTCRAALVAAPNQA